MTHRNHRCRRAALTVEAAIVLPVMIFLILFLIVGGMGVFVYQQTALQAREAARYASVHGSRWHQATKGTAPTQAQIFQNAVLPLAVAMDTTVLAIEVDLVNGITGAVTPWDSSNHATQALTTTNQGVANHVRVTVTYQWTPGGLLPGTFTMTSVSEVPMSF